MCERVRIIIKKAKKALNFLVKFKTSINANKVKVFFYGGLVS